LTQHPYCYPGSDVLRNKEDIRDSDELEAFERTASGRRLEMLPSNLPISVVGYREIHRYIFQDVYAWAGEYRTVNTGRTGPFCKTEYIAREMERRFAAILAENDLRGLALDAFASRAAEHMCELNAIHCFLEGNGRTQRAFLELLAAQAGHAVDLARIDPDAWNAAAASGFHTQDYRPLACRDCRCDRSRRLVVNPETSDRPAPCGSAPSRLPDPPHFR
jgi:cell filamentation protein